MKNLGYICAFLGGAALGATVGILTAPAKGEDTRKKISDTVKGYCKKHSIKLSNEDMEDLVDDLSLLSNKD